MLFDLAGHGIHLFRGPDKRRAIATLCANHYTHSVPSGKSYYLGFEGAIVVWSIPANPYIGRFLLGEDATVWELSRLWAIDGHPQNLLTRAISAAVKFIAEIAQPDILVSYADPNVGHHGGVYRAASWVACGQSEESRGYRDQEGLIVARRAFHSGNRGMTKVEIEAAGYTQVAVPGKLRFVKPLSRRAKRLFAGRF